MASNEEQYTVSQSCRGNKSPGGRVRHLLSSGGRVACRCGTALAWRWVGTLAQDQNLEGLERGSITEELESGTSVSIKGQPRIPSALGYLAASSRAPALLHDGVWSLGPWEKSKSGMLRFLTK